MSMLLAMTFGRDPIEALLQVYGTPTDEPTLRNRSQNQLSREVISETRE